MLYGQIKPTVVKIVRSRLRYRLWGLPLMKPLRVIGCNMKYLMVADERVVKVHQILWKDIELVESERVAQVPVVQTIDRSKVVDRRRGKESFFKAGTK